MPDPPSLYCRKPIEFSLLPTPTTVAGVEFSQLFVCCFSDDIWEMDAARSPNLTHTCSTMSPENSFVLGSKGQRSRSQRLCRSSDRTQYCRCCCVHKPRWVFPAVMPRRTSNVSDTGFSLLHFPASACRWGLPDVGFCALLSAGFC